MPQLFQVLRCYKCLVFQVHQTKKTNKWECKMCGEKQSVKRHYGLGTPKDCRLHVQKLNGIRGEVDELKRNLIDTDEETENETPRATVVETQLKKESRWCNYVEETATPSSMDNNNSVYLNDSEVVLELPQKRRRTIGNPNKKKNIKSLPFNEAIDAVVQSSVREETLCSPLKKSALEITNIKKKVLECNPQNENIDGIMQYCSGIYKAEPTLSLEFPYSSVMKEVSTSRQVVKKNKLSAINKNSKWAQFADEEESTEEIEKQSSPCVEQLSEEYDDLGEGKGNLVSMCIEQSHNNLNDLFALCDDDELDHILDL